MEKWLVKEFGRITAVSVQTLHYYDRIGLLKPSVRGSNKYRMYDQNDLLKLQKIIALRHFGFKLQQIKAILKQDLDMTSHLQAQIRCLEMERLKLSRICSIAHTILDTLHAKQPIQWQLIIQLIGGYTMEQINNFTVAQKIFSPDQFKRYKDVAYSKSFDFWENWGAEWQLLIKDVQSVISEDPYGACGQLFAKKWMALVTQIGHDRDVGQAIWTAYKNGTLSTDEAKREHWTQIPPDVVDWIDKAAGFMYTGKKK